MATGAEAVMALAEAADLLPASVDRVFRTLQAPKDDHAPIGKLGGGKSTPHMDLHHLRNLGLGVTAQPLTAAVQWVDRICGFTASADAKHDGELADTLISSNFGRCFEHLIEQAAAPGNKGRTDRVSVQILLNEQLPMMATVTTRDEDGILYSARYLPIGAATQDRGGGLSRTVTITAILLRTLGDLWRGNPGAARCA